MRGNETQVGSADVVWQFDPTQMMPGDVVLEHGHSKFSSIIMRVDKGHYSHALIWLGGGDFLEAVGAGVRVISFARVFVLDPSEWVVLRHTDPRAGIGAALQARSMAHKKYDLWGAISAKYVFARLDSTKLFCSQLVAVAYEAAGYPVVERKKSFQVTPNMLIGGACLQAVNPIPLTEMKLQGDDWLRIDDQIDRDRAYMGSKMSEEMKISQEVLAIVRPMYPQFAPPADTGLSSPPGSLHEALSLLQLIDEPTSYQISDRMAKELDKRGYFALVDDELKGIGMRRLTEAAQLKMGQIHGEELERLANHLVVGAEGRTMARVRHGENANAYQLLFIQRNLAVFDRLHQMHRMIEMNLILIEENEQEILAECQKLLTPTFSPTVP